MDLGFIDPDTYANPTYFDFYDENMLGLAPMSVTTETESLLSRQFLY